MYATPRPMAAPMLGLSSAWLVLAGGVLGNFVNLVR